MPTIEQSRPAVLLFDVNETLVDLNPLREKINEILLEGDGANLWFATLLQYSLAMTVAGQYAPFHEIGAAVLRMLARNREVVLDEEGARKALAPMRSLPPHPDVRPALEELRQAGFRLAALTNSSVSTVQAQLAHAGLADCFERQLSVESVGKYKPHADVYRWAAGEMKVEPKQCMLVAAHGWDVAGAKWAGMQAAFVARVGQQIFPLAGMPDIIVNDFRALADKLKVV
jgi:2-haloacid dehalogenase